MARGAGLWLEGLRRHQELGLGGRAMEEQVPQSMALPLLPKGRDRKRPMERTWSSERSGYTELLWVLSAKGDLKCVTDTGVISGW